VVGAGAAALSVFAGLLSVVCVACVGSGSLLGGGGGACAVSACVVGFVAGWGGVSVRVGKEGAARRLYVAAALGRRAARKKRAHR